MSTIKNPREKKLLSLKNDRRSVYGESPTPSRKNVAREKQRSHQQERHAVTGVLSGQYGPSCELDADAAENTVKDRVIRSRRKSFKKQPDVSLAEALYQKVTGKPAKNGGGAVKAVTWEILSAIRGRSPQGVRS